MVDGYRKYYSGYRKNSYGSKGSDYKTNYKQQNRPEKEEIKKEWIQSIEQKEGQKGKYLLVRTKKYAYYVPAEDELTIQAIQDDEDHTFLAVNGRLTIKAKDGINITNSQYIARAGTDNRPLVESRDPKDIENSKGTREFRISDAITLINNVITYAEDIRNYLLSLEQAQQIYAQQQKKEAKKEGESNDTESTEFSE
jgi:hypothetical protein